MTRFRDFEQDRFYRDGGGFHWCRPKLTIYVPVDKRPRAMWNRYLHNTIGAALVITGRCLSVTWKR